MHPSSRQLRQHVVRRRELAEGRLDPQSRAAAVYAVARFAVALIAVISLAVANAAAAGTSLAPPLLLHAAFAAVALLTMLAVLAADDAGRRRWARRLVLADVAAYALYSVAFASVPGAGSLVPMFVLLAAPLLWGWRGLPVTAVPVILIASLWPQQDALGHTTGTGEVILLVVLLTVPAAAVSVFVQRGSARLARAEEQFRTAFDDASSGMALLDAGARVVRANPALHALLGVDDLTGRPLREHAVDPEEFAARLQTLSCRQLAARFETCLRAADGATRWVSVVASAICDGEQVRRVIVQTEDVTERRQLQDRLTFDATHDSLTGLPNQRVVQDLLQSALDDGRHVAVLFVDLDRFKLVNDSLGHAVGDRLLVATARRLQSCVRPEDVVARLGGDEFVVLCSAGPDGAAVDGDAVAQRVVLALRAPHLTEDGVLTATASVGVAVATSSADVGSLIRDADTAMYAAKSAGGNRSVVFSEQLRLDVVRRHEIEVALRSALTEDGLQLAYQPIIDEAGRIVAAEALLRWHFQGQPANPAEVVAVAEQSGLIGDLGLVVLRRALLDSAGWPAHVRLHVNVSAHQLDAGFVEQLSAVLQQTCPEPGRLCLELTETAVRDDVEGLAVTLQQVRALGVRLAIDDFGVGNASLTYLARLPVRT